MAINRTKVQAQAQKFVLKGQIDKAIKEYLTLVDDEPGDLKVCQKLGDLYAKKGDKANACEQYNKIASDYKEKGFYLKAIAVYKQVVRIDPDDLNLYLQLGDLYHKQGLPAEAMAQYRIVAGRYEKEGKVEEALETIGKMADIDPSNVMLRVKLAENYLKAGLKEKALAEVLKAGSELSSQKKYEELINLYEKFAKAGESNAGLFKGLSRAYLDKGDDTKAIASLKNALKVDPDDISSLSTIADLYKKTGDAEKAKLSLQQMLRVDSSSIDARKALHEIYNAEGDAERAVSEYEAIIDIHLKNELFDEALESVQLLRESHPDNFKVMGKLCEIHRFMNEEEKLVASYKELAAMYGERGEQAQSDSIYEKILELRPDDADALEQKGKGGGEEAPAEAEADSDTPLSNSQIGKLLTEVDVYIKYGMEDKAEGSLQEILRRNPQSVAAMLKLKDYYLGAGKKSEAVDELLKVAEIARESDDDEKAVECLKEALKLSPDSKPAGEMYSAITGEDPELLLAEDIDVEIDLEVDGDVIELEAEDDVIELEAGDDVIELEAGDDVIELEAG
ncbi:MAG: tetratricopeptide repeat protein, partial [Proteobacteria bacterium]|nr:tetratricopeptide repeat protein [Pseudomonadota bacterium]